MHDYNLVAEVPCRVFWLASNSHLGIALCADGVLQVLMLVIGPPRCHFRFIMEKYAILVGYYNKQFQIIEKLYNEIIPIDIGIYEKRFMFALLIN